MKYYTQKGSLLNNNAHGAYILQHKNSKKRRGLIEGDSIMMINCALSSSSSLDRIKVGDTDDGADNGGEHDPTGGNAKQEVLEGGAYGGGFSHIRYHHRGCQSSS